MGRSIFAFLPVSIVHVGMYDDMNTIVLFKDDDTIQFIQNHAEIWYNPQTSLIRLKNRGRFFDENNNMMAMNIVLNALVGQPFVDTFKRGIKRRFDESPEFCYKHEKSLKLSRVYERCVFVNHLD